MQITVPLITEDYSMFKSIIEQGIDAHLEAFTESMFEEKYIDGQPRLIMDFQGKDVAILVRRLKEYGTEDAELWAQDIEDNDEDMQETQRRDEKNGLYPDKWDDAN